VQTVKKKTLFPTACTVTWWLTIMLIFLLTDYENNNNKRKNKQTNIAKSTQQLKCKVGVNKTIKNYHRNKACHSESEFMLNSDHC